MNKDIAIKVENLSKVYKLYNAPIDRMKEALHPFKKNYHKEFYALNDVSFEIKKGEIVGVIGKNGCGKSTLLKIITGVLTPTTGKVMVNGRISALLELGAGFNPEYTGMENIYFQGNLMGLSREEMKAKVEGIIKFADIGDFIYQPVKNYSSGMFARLAFAVGISIDPEIFIVDEVLAVGDMNFQAKCMTAMERIRKKGTTILFVSHDIGSVKSICKSAIYIKSGVLHAVGKSSDVAELYSREMRLESNAEIKNSLQLIEENIEKKASSFVTKAYNSEFKTSREFDERVAQFREGTGEVKITFVELLDMDGNPILEAEFNQKVKLRIFVESYAEKTISVGFHLRDDKKISIVTCGFNQAGENLLLVKEGDKLIAEYVFSLPLQHNTYSILASVLYPVILDVQHEYIDIVEDAYIFKIAKRPGATLWSKVDLFPELSVKFYKSADDTENENKEFNAIN